jgi:N-acetyl-anhydromuramyl-L-alanine amidase AmpD
MYPFNNVTDTKKFTKGVNTRQFIIIHHTWGGNYQSNLKYLSESTAQASVHFIIWADEEVAKIATPDKILWHAWQSCRGNLEWMNKYSLWIEVVWFGGYNTKQLIRLTDLVEYLMAVYNIPKENVLRHSDIAQRWEFSKKKILWDWKRASRKTDIGLNFFPMWFETWRNQLTPRPTSRYGKYN